MDVRDGYPCLVLCPALDMALSGQSKSLEREATGLIKNLLNIC